jgi:hypothetical protein
LLGGSGGGADDSDEEDKTPNLWPYFNACYSSYVDDDPKGFYTVFQKVGVCTVNVRAEHSRAGRQSARIERKTQRNEQKRTFLES